jgi:hypothetical protein
MTETRAGHPSERGERVQLAIESVDRRAADWPRLATDADRVAYFREVFDDLPPIVVEAGSNRLIDGWHRVEAALALGRELIAAEAILAPPDGILAASLGYAARTAKPLTRAERRRAIELLLREQPARSDRWLASIAGVSPASVASIRAELEFRGQVTAAEQRVGRDGRERSLPRREPRDESAPAYEPEIDGFDPYDETDEPPVEDTARIERRPNPSTAEPVHPTSATMAELDDHAAARRFMRELLDLLATGMERYPSVALAEMLRQGAPGYPPDRVRVLAGAWGELFATLSAG